MATNFKHLETLPLDEDNLIINDNPESNLQSKACLNLGFNALNSIERLFNIVNINNNSSSQEPSFLNLSYGLESLLATVLNLNSVSNITNTQLSPHYLKRQTNINANKILPSFGYCQNLTFTRFKTWGGLYGSLPYYINLLEEYEEYYTPSEITYYAAKSLFQYSKQVIFSSSISSKLNNDLLISFYDQAVNILDDESLEADKQIYNLSINVILSHPLIRELFTELNFYEEWLIKIIEWKQKGTRNNENISIEDNPSTNQQRAINTLLKCNYIIQELGFDNNIINNLSASFIRQSHSSNFNELISKLSEQRKECTYIKITNETPSDLSEILIIEFLDKISKFRNPFDFKDACNLIQETLCPPGGYTLLLLTLSACLINRAYILSYNNINNTEDLRSNTYKRIIKLLGLASILLIKTNNTTIQIVGENILKTFEIYIDNIDSNNLLDNYT